MNEINCFLILFLISALYKYPIISLLFSEILKHIISYCFIMVSPTELNNKCEPHVFTIPH